MNAIHFNGYWEKPFAEKDTVVHSFFTNVKLATQVPFMVRTDDFYYCASAELDARVLRIPYRVRSINLYLNYFRNNIRFEITSGIQIRNVHHFTK